MKKLLVLCLTLLMLVGLCGCKKEEEKEVLKIGLSTALSDNGDGKLQKEVVDMFVEKWNKENTFGFQVEFVAYDNMNNNAQDTEMSIKNTNKLINQDEVDIIISGQMSNIIQATGQLIEDAGIIDIGLGLSDTWMKQGWKYVYRTALNNAYQVPSFTVSMKSLNQKTVSVLYANTDNSLTYKDSFKSACETAGIKVVAEEMISLDGTGISGQINSAIKVNPDCIFVTTNGGGFGTVVKQLRQAGYKGIIYLGQNLSATEVDSIGVEELNGVVMCSPYITYTSVDDCTNEYIKNVLSTYQAKYGTCPFTDMIYKAWDACLLIENAVKAAKSNDPAKIQAAISTLKFEGCAGTMDFTTGSNECYFAARAWVYTGNGSGGAPVVMEDWLTSDLAKKIVLTNSK